jgi:hypothetical protein
MSQPPVPGQPHPTDGQSGTVLETDEDIRQALLAAAKGQLQDAPVVPKAASPPTPSAGRPASPFRPTARPPVPILTVSDDGKMDGEAIRIREPRFTIGRNEGDLRFPLDGRMSSRHVEITHQFVGGLHRWVVTDLQSMHGMFVRVTRTALADKAEFLVGNGRYRFDAGQPERDATANDVTVDLVSGETQGWDEGTSAFRPAALTELLGREIGNRLVLVNDEYAIGSDPSCAVCRRDDPFCDPRQARLFRDARGHWHVEHNKTQNGLWLRMAQITVESTIRFQIGEQRFMLKVN